MTSERTAFLVGPSGEQTPVGDGIMIGREAGVALRLDDPAVSRRHAVVRRTDSGFEIEDLQSANGTYINGGPIAGPRILRTGDRITVGTIELAFVAPEPVEEQTDLTVVSNLSDLLSFDREQTMVASWSQEEAQPSLAAESATESGLQAIPDAAPERADATPGAKDTDAAESQAPEVTESRSNAESPTLTGDVEEEEAVVTSTASAEVVTGAFEAPEGAEPEATATVGGDVPAIASQAAGESRARGDTDSLGTVVPPNALQVATRIARAAREAADLGEALRAVLEQLEVGYRVRLAAVYLTDAARAQLQCALAAGQDASEALGREVRWGQGLVGRAADERRAQLDGQTSEGAGAGARPASALAVPIELRGGSVVGALEMRTPLWKEQFGQEDLDLAVLVAQHLGLSWPEEVSWLQLARELQGELRALAVQNRFVTADPGLREIVARCMQAADERRPVYIWGEPGTGRRYLARVAGQFALGDDAPFVLFDCAAVARSAQIEAIFGETGAVWHAATKGMLCFLHAEQLDEAVLQSIREHLTAGPSPLIAFSGTTELVAADARALAEDYFHLPPLRERTGDLAAIARRLVQATNERYETRFAGFQDSALALLATYTWPGNVAELAGVVAQMAFFGAGFAAGADTLARLIPDVFGSDGANSQDGLAGDTVRSLVAGLIGGNADVRAGAAGRLQELSQASRAAVVGAVLRTVESSDDVRARVRGIEALGCARDLRLTRYLTDFLNDPDRRLRAAAIVALGQITPEDSAVAQLQTIVGGEDPALALLAMLALGRLSAASLPELALSVLDREKDWKLRAAAVVALGRVDSTLPAVRTALLRLLDAGDMLPISVVQQARSDEVLSEEDLMRLLGNPALSVSSKARLIQLIGQSDEPGDVDLLARLALLDLGEEPRRTLAGELARRGEAALPAILRLVGSSTRQAQAVGLAALGQLSRKEASLSGLLNVASDAALLSALPQALGRQRDAFASAVVDQLYADWRLDSLLRLLRLLAATHGEDLVTPDSN